MTQAQGCVGRSFPGVSLSGLLSDRDSVGTLGALSFTYFTFFLLPDSSSHFLQNYFLGLSFPLQAVVLTQS